MKLDKTNTGNDALVADISTAEVFFSYGMRCVGCPSRVGETIEQAARKHGADLDEMLEQLNACIAGANADSSDK